jgi:cell division protein FtsL
MPDKNDMKFFSININTVLTSAIGAGVIWLVTSTQKLQTDMVDLRVTLRSKAEQIDKMSTQVDELQRQTTDLRIRFSEIRSVNPK